MKTLKTLSLINYLFGLPSGSSFIFYTEEDVDETLTLLQLIQEVSVRDKYNVHVWIVEDTEDGRISIDEGDANFPG